MSGEGNELGRDILGPIFYEWMWRLYICLSSQPSGTPVLFQARGGLRIKLLFEKFLKVNGLQLEVSLEEFYISRLACSKGTYLGAPVEVTKLFLNEFLGKEISELEKAITGECSGKLGLVDFENIQSILNSPELNEVFKVQQKLLRDYIMKLANGRTHIITVDTGWAATTQKLLMRSFEEFEWLGLYFGKWNTNGGECPHFHNVVGLMSDMERDKKGRKTNSSIFHYHHLIEDPLEPEIPSTRGYMTSSDNGGQVIPDIDLTSLDLSKDSKGHFSGILEYFGKSISREESFKKSMHSFKQLAKKIMWPTSKSLSGMMMGERSHDFGKSGRAHIIPECNTKGLGDKFQAVRLAIWKQGAIRYLFGPLSLPILLVYNHKKNRLLAFILRNIKESLGA